MSEQVKMTVGSLELRKAPEGWLYLSEGDDSGPDHWCDAGSSVGPFNGSGVNNLLDELYDARNEFPCGAAAAAIQFALQTDEGMVFLHYWNQGEFDVIRSEWPEAPEEVYIGADPLYVSAVR